MSKMVDMEKEYEEKIAKELEEKKGQSIEEGNALIELVQSRGWKLVQKYADLIMSVERLKAKPETISGLTLHEITYIQGQVQGMEQLFKLINVKIAQRNSLLKQESEK